MVSKYVPPEKAYAAQKNTSAQRGIEFLLTYEEWLQIWADSGHLPDRGKGKDKYCMARHGDRGPYAVGNVKIVTLSENRQEDLALGGRERHSIVMSGRKHTAEHNKKIGDANRGKPCSDERKRKISHAAKKRWSEVGRSRLTEQDIQDIINSTERTAVLAKAFGVTQNTILNVRQKWSNQPR